MSTAAHTGGPWTACFTTINREVEGFHISGQPYGSTAPICEARYAGFAPQLEANARLIAAAPDLLDALKTVIAQIEDYERVNNLAPNPGRKHCWDSVAHAHAVIAEAEGTLIADDRGTK